MYSTAVLDGIMQTILTLIQSKVTILGVNIGRKSGYVLTLLKTRCSYSK
jgi:hypothetical protein